jgi:hypothetical protein
MQATIDSNFTSEPLIGQSDSAATPADPDVEDFKRSYDWFVVARTLEGERRLCERKQMADTFRKDILEGALNSASVIDVYAKTNEGQWGKTASPLAQVAKGEFKLRVLYEPVWSHAMAGLKWGALIGIGLKFIDTLILLGAVDLRIAVMFLIVAAVCAIPRIGMAAVIVASLVMSKFTSVNLFVTLGTVMLIGSILGSLPGMAVGGAIGLGRRRTLPLAGDAKPEREGLALKAVVLPLLGGLALWGLYLFVFNPWLISIMSKR